MREHGGNNDKNKNNGNRCLCTEQIITNDDLAKVVDTSDEWISQRTGIEREGFLGRGEHFSFGNRNGKTGDRACRNLTGRCAI